MSLADRLAKAQQRDRIADVRLRVQERLVEVLGPRLYDSTLSDNELEGLVHQRLRELLDEEEGPLSAQEKLLIVRQIGDSVLGLGPLEPFVRDPDVTEIMVNGWDTIYVERAGKLYWTGTKFHDEQQLRRTIDKIVGEGRPPRRRGVARTWTPVCPTARVSTRSSRRSRSTARRSRSGSSRPTRISADDLIEFGTMTSPVSQFLEACVRGRINILVVRRNGRREDHDAERAVVVHPRRRAHHHDRGRGRAPAAAAARGPPGVPPAEHRGQGAGRDPRPGPQRPADAARPDRRR